MPQGVPRTSCPKWKDVCYRGTWHDQGDLAQMIEFTQDALVVSPFITAIELDHVDIPHERERPERRHSENRLASMHKI